MHQARKREKQNVASFSSIEERCGLEQTSLNVINSALNLLIAVNLFTFPVLWNTESMRLFNNLPSLPVVYTHS